MNDDPYATHIPLLTAIGLSYPVRRVLELGAGLYSTPLFLDRAVFPFLEGIWSIESDPDWMEKVFLLCNGDRRLNIYYSQGGYVDSHEPFTYSDFDLILVDNGKNRPERVTALQVVNELKSPNNLIVVHDYEQTDYQGIIDMPHCYLDNHRTPHTALFWDQAPIEVAKLCVS